MNDYTMSSAGDLISALPSIMGYVPQARAVAVTMRRNDSGGLQLRNVISIPVTTAPEHAATLPDICGVTITNTAAVILIAVCGPEHLAQAGVVLDAMRNAFLDADIPVRQRLLTASVTEAGHWMDIDTGQTGPQVAYTDSIFTAMSIVGGRPVVTSRDDLIEEFRETDPAPLLAASTAAQSPVDTAEELATVIAGAPMSPTLPTRAGLAILASARMRDVMILLGMEQPYAGCRAVDHHRRAPTPGRPRRRAHRRRGAVLRRQRHHPRRHRPGDRQRSRRRPRHRLPAPGRPAVHRTARRHGPADSHRGPAQGLRGDGQPELAHRPTGPADPHTTGRPGLSSSGVLVFFFRVPAFLAGRRGAAG